MFLLNENQETAIICGEGAIIICIIYLYIYVCVCVCIYVCVFNQQIFF